MLDIIIKSLDEGIELPTRGSKIKASNDLISWEEKYYVQLDTSNETPFICVEMERDIHLPASRGKKYKYISRSVYEVTDLVQHNDYFITRDNLYITEKDKINHKVYWQRTDFAKQIGITSYFLNKEKHEVDIKNIKRSIELLNKITK